MLERLLSMTLPLAIVIGFWVTVALPWGAPG